MDVVWATAAGAAARQARAAAAAASAAGPVRSRPMPEELAPRPGRNAQTTRGPAVPGPSGHVFSARGALGDREDLLHAVDGAVQAALDVALGGAQLALGAAAVAPDRLLAAALEPAQLALRTVTVGVRADGVRDVVARGQHGADRDVRHAAELLADGLEARGL